ncbi:DivIVA domain-containing protein [Actinoplanes sp. NPDC026619]|uniref:DivIVA domain-containing protein n=1 Tax=Actinoplanes sp. NPDC026619 TaxID=3155798 RepID=UPI00340EF90D
MPLTPADIHNMAFKKPPMGKRGYDEEEVDAFLDEVEQELIRLLEENNVLSDQMQRGGGGGGLSPSSSTTNMALNAELNDLVAQLERLQEARARAEQNARNVQAELERSRNQALTPLAPVDDDRNARVLMMAQRTADDHMRDAKSESEQLIGSARGKAEQLTSEAQLNAATIESDARRNHTEAISSIGAKRAAMLDEIDRLGQLAQSYHNALNTHVTQQLAELNGAPESGIG